MMDRLDENWQAWSCADCDPEFDDIGEPSGHDQAYVLLLPEGTEAPDFCPRCSGHLSFCEGASELRITNTPAERYAARHAREA